MAKTHVAKANFHLGKKGGYNKGDDVSHLDKSELERLMSEGLVHHHSEAAKTPEAPAKAPEAVTAEMPPASEPKAEDQEPKEKEKHNKKGK